MKLNHRPPTEKMIAKLRDCHDKQSKSGNGDPCLQEELKGALAGLYKRGLVETKLHDINGKRLLCLFVTDTGAEYLKGLEEQDRKNLNQ